MATVLSSSKVYRGGATSYYDLELETASIRFEGGWRRKTGNFKFSIASKGGGTTVIRLEISLDDIGPILAEFLSAHPEVSTEIIKVIPLAFEKQQLLADQRVGKAKDAIEASGEAFVRKYSRDPLPSENAVEIVKKLLDAVREKL